MIARRRFAVVGPTDALRVLRVRVQRVFFEQTVAPTLRRQESDPQELHYVAAITDPLQSNANRLLGKAIGRIADHDIERLSRITLIPLLHINDRPQAIGSRFCYPPKFYPVNERRGPVLTRSLAPRALSGSQIEDAPGALAAGVPRPIGEQTSVVDLFFQKLKGDFHYGFGGEVDIGFGAGG